MKQDDELSRYMMLIEQYKEEIQNLDLQLQYTQAATTDYNKAKMTLEQLVKEKKDVELLMPIGGSTYITTTANNTSKVLFDIGNGIVAEKNTEDAIKKIDDRISLIQKSQEKIKESIEQLNKEAVEISTKAQQLMQQQKK